MNLEIECRLLEVNPKEFIKKLKEQSATFIGDWIQVRSVYDFNPINENSWIRLRTNGVETTLTIKEITSSQIDGTKEWEIVVSDFNTTDEILNKLGYHARNKQENRRIRYMLDDVEIDIDFWPQIPAYVEFEGKSEQAIKNVCAKLDIDFNQLITLDVNRIYKYYGIDMKKIPVIELEKDIKELKFDFENNKPHNTIDEFTR